MTDKLYLATQKFSRFKKEGYKHKILTSGDTRIRDSVFRASDVAHLLQVSASGASEILAEMIDEGTVVSVPPGQGGVKRYCYAPKTRPLRDSWRTLSNEEIFGDLFSELSRLGLRL